MASSGWPAAFPDTVRRSAFPRRRGANSMVDKVEKIWLDGEFVDLGRRAGPHPHALAALRPRRLRGHPRLQARGRQDARLPAARAHRAPLRLVQADAARAELHARADHRRRASRCSASNKMAEGYLRPMVFVGDGAMGIYAPNNPVRTTSSPGSGARTSATRRSRAASAQDQLVRAPPHQRRASPRARSWASTRTACSPSARRSSAATTRPSSSTRTATCARARARTSSS